MIKAEEYFEKIPYDFDIPNIKEWVCEQIKQAQIDIIEELRHRVNKTIVTKESIINCFEILKKELNFNKL